MNHLKLTLQIIFKRLFKGHFFIIILFSHLLSFGQKDCNVISKGLVPLTDMGSTTYRGFQGGLYPEGSNIKPSQHQVDLLEAAKQIQKLDNDGLVSASGKIVFIGVGASNPRTEFDQFVGQAKAFGNLNPDIVFANTCIGGQGVQKMNLPTDSYWQMANQTLDSMGLTAAQVQIAWIETENTQTADTVFPGAPQALVNDLQQLLKTLLIKFPNLRICYFSPRAFSGFAIPTQSGVGKGLLFPRDYYNGWAGKWLIQKIIERESGYEFSGPGKVIPLCTFGSYHWNDGNIKRKDGFILDCATEVGSDGLHLTEAGEAKIAGQMFDFFAKDSLASQWFLKSVALNNMEKVAVPVFNIYPNPLSDGQLSITINSINVFQRGIITIYDVMGKQVFQEIVFPDSERLDLYLPMLSKGLYYLQIKFDGQPLFIEKLNHL